MLKGRLLRGRCQQVSSQITSHSQRICAYIITQLDEAEDDGALRNGLNQGVQVLELLAGEIRGARHSRQTTSAEDLRCGKAASEEGGRGGGSGIQQAVMALYDQITQSIAILVIAVKSPPPPNLSLDRVSTISDTLLWALELRPETPVSILGGQPEPNALQ